MGRLQDKIAVIVGGTSGIGLATARRFVEEGAHVFVFARRGSELADAASEMDGRLTTVQGDVARLPDLDRLYAEVAAKKGSLDIVVSCAAFFEAATLEQASEEHLQRTFDVNVRGPFFTVKKAIPLMRDHGAIVLVGSASHLKGIPNYVAYSATKAAQRSFVRSWAAELKDRSIRVNALSPGPIDTPMLSTQIRAGEDLDAVRSRIAAMVPLGRLGRADEMASAILFLASDESGYVTGIDLVADGGLTQI